jgi:hypothetical protein
MVLKVHTLLGDAAEFGKGENLKTATVGENRTIPAHEGMKSPEIADDLFSGTDMEVVGIAQDNACAEGSEFVRRDSFDRSLRAHGHKNRRLHISPPGMQNASASLAGGIGLEKGIGRRRTHGNYKEILIGLKAED